MRVTLNLAKQTSVLSYRNSSYNSNRQNISHRQEPAFSGLKVTKEARDNIFVGMLCAFCFSCLLIGGLYNKQKDKIEEQETYCSLLEGDKTAVEKCKLDSNLPKTFLGTVEAGVEGGWNAVREDFREMGEGAEIVAKGIASAAKKAVKK